MNLDLVRNKRKYLMDAVRFIENSGNVSVSAVDVCENLGISINDFKMFLEQDLIDVMKSRGWEIRFGTYDVESGITYDRVIPSGGKMVVIPIFTKV